MTNRFKEKKRGRQTRKKKPIIYIICEGEETETTYFNRFKSREKLVKIKASKHTSALALVENAEDVAGNEDYRPQDGDQLWCVFDRDDNTDADLRKAELLAKRNKYDIAFSNPSFELWFLLHFTDQKSSVEDGHEVIRKLKTNGRIPNYSKTEDYFDLLKPQREVAIARAQKLEEKHLEEGTKILSRGSNPSTSVSYLIEELLG